jgi:hypothetical protein
LPKNEEFVDENGIRTTIEYTLNEDGKKVKVRISLLEFEALITPDFRSLVESNEPCRNPSWTLLSQKDKNGRSSAKRREASQDPTGLQRPSERMLH